MASLKDIKQRIRSVRNTSQITKAMEVVSATKMRRSQSSALSGRPYALAALDILKNISQRSVFPASLFARREVKKTLMLVITSDKGLAGAFNANVLRLAERWMASEKADCAIAVLGKKARDYFSRRGHKLVASFAGFGDFVSLKETRPLADFIFDGYLRGEWDRVVVFYTNFRTTLKQEARMAEVLPVHPESIETTIKNITPEYGKYADISREREKLKYRYEYKFEPSPEKILEALLQTLFRIQVHHIILESNASEHSARMVAMKNASDNAKELIGELSIEYNKSRQAGITRELTEITAGKEALEV